VTTKLHLNSLRFKVSVLAMLILTAVLVVYSTFLYITVRYTLYQDLDETLAVKAKKINNAITSYLNVLGYDDQSFEFVVNRVITRKGEHPHKNQIEKLENLWLGQSKPLGISADYVAFLDSTGRPLVYSNNLRPSVSFEMPKNAHWFLEGRPAFKNVDLGKNRLRAVFLPVTYEKMRKKKIFLIIVLTSRERVIHILQGRLITKVVSIIIILVLASFLSQIFAESVLKPVRDITQIARSINYKDLSVRIREENVDLEMRDLVDALNKMMARLEKSFMHIAEFSSHVSHELKTPLAILRGETELALRSEHSPQEYKKIIQSNLEEIRRMTKIIEDLLLLTKLDYQQRIFNFEDFDLVEFFKEIADSTKILTAEKEFILDVRLPDNPIPVHADKVHLRRLFFNLINNAIKFTQPNGAIGIHLEASGRESLISITDTGAGIPKENLQKIFDKFFHYNGIGASDPPGNGLGLSIAQSIAKAHSGDIQVQSTVGKGSIFTVRLPLPSSIVS
jgi:two-component system heavy metal sensor histidine kinase CusS